MIELKSSRAEVVDISSNEKKKLHIQHETSALLAFLLFLLVLIVLDQPGVFSLVRLLSALIFLLFIPGYFVQAGLFPRACQLSAIERTALSLGGSIAVIPPLTLLVDILPFWELETSSIFISSAGVSLMIGTFSWQRRRQIPEEERYGLVIPMPKTGMFPPSLRDWAIAFAVIALVGLTAISASFIVRSPAASFTEFYILGASNTAENYPTQITVDEPVNIKLGIRSHESAAQDYYIRVMVGEEIISTTEPITLEPGEMIEHNLEFALPRAGDNTRIIFELYQSEHTEPYRSLSLLANVAASDTE